MFGNVIVQSCLKYLPVTSVLVFAVAGNMTTAIALVTVCFAIAGRTAVPATAVSAVTVPAAVAVSAVAVSAGAIERNAAYRSVFLAIPSEMSRTVAPITHYSTAHDD